MGMEEQRSLVFFVYNFLWRETWNHYCEMEKKNILVRHINEICIEEIWSWKKHQNNAQHVCSLWSQLYITIFSIIVIGKLQAHLTEKLCSPFITSKNVPRRKTKAYLCKTSTFWETGVVSKPTYLWQLPRTKQVSELVYYTRYLILSLKSLWSKPRILCKHLTNCIYSEFSILCEFQFIHNWLENTSASPYVQQLFENPVPSDNNA